MRDIITDWYKEKAFKEGTYRETALGHRSTIGDINITVDTSFVNHLPRETNGCLLRDITELPSRNLRESSEKTNLCDVWKSFTSVTTSPPLIQSQDTSKVA